jgi:hypothetical protein
MPINSGGPERTFRLFHKGHPPVCCRRVKSSRLNWIMRANVVQEFKLAKVGLEPSDASSLPLNDLRKSKQEGAAKSGAVTVETVLALLAALSPSDRARLAALLTGQAEGEARP